MARRVFGIFEYEDDFLAATRRIYESGYRDLTTMTPVPVHGLDEILQKKKPIIRQFTFFGALFGFIGGFSLATFSALAFIQPTGGRGIIAFPPFLIISYEGAILGGVLATLVGFYIASGLPAWRDEPYDLTTGIDRFSILVDCESEQDVARIEAIMREQQVEEIRYPDEESAEGTTDSGTRGEEQQV